MLLRTACALLAMSAGLSACGGNGETASNATVRASAVQASMGPAAGTDDATKFSLADGPDVCFRAVAKQLGADAKVSEVTSFFSVGKEIDPSADAPQGAMTTCTVQYQDPDDARKLLETSMDKSTGAFPPPRPVEITVMGGDASQFKLEDHLIALSRLNPAGLRAIMDAQKGPMSAIYGKYAWSGVRLESPGAFDAGHTLRLDIEGRLASNDIKDGGYASISIDGKTITRNYLKP